MTVLKSALVAAIAVAGLAGAAIAKDRYVTFYDSTQTSVNVPTWDLNLNRNAGADAFLIRADRVAQRACGQRPQVDPTYPENIRDFRSCRNYTMRRAVEATGSRVVSRRYYSSRGQVIIN